MFKDLGESGLSERARAAKPEFLYDPLREIETYRSILAPAGLGTAGLLRSRRSIQPHGSLLALHRERPRRRALADRRAGGLGAGGTLGCGAAQPLRRRGPGQRSPATTRACCATTPTSTGSGCAARVDFADRWEARQPGGRARRSSGSRAATTPVVERLAALPVTFIHGELYASNVLVAQDDGRDTRLPDRLGDGGDRARA